MNSNTQKLVAYAALALICALIIAVWGIFAFYGKTPVDGFISQLGGLLTIVVGAIAALGATHVAAASRSNVETLTPGKLVGVKTFQSAGTYTPTPGTTSIGPITLGGSGGNSTQDPQQ